MTKEEDLIQRINLAAERKSPWPYASEIISALTASEKRAETARDDALGEAANIADGVAADCGVAGASAQIAANKIRAMKGQRS